MAIELIWYVLGGILLFDVIFTFVRDIWKMHKENKENGYCHYLNSICHIERSHCGVCSYRNIISSTHQEKK
jgi:hypothetical protein